MFSCSHVLTFWATFLRRISRHACSYKCSYVCFGLWLVAYWQRGPQLVRPPRPYIRITICWRQRCLRSPGPPMAEPPPTNPPARFGATSVNSICRSPDCRTSKPLVFPQKTHKFCIPLAKSHVCFMLYARSTTFVTSKPSVFF